MRKVESSYSGFKRALFFISVIGGMIVMLALWNGDRRKPMDKPKIVVGLMVDQMRWDYLYKFQDRYTEGGIKRLLREGFNCENTMIRHAPTVTAAGHASVYTGSVPAVNGIIENDWYDREWGRKISNVEDTTVSIIGMPSHPGRSPRNLLTTTIGDELKLATNFQSKVVGVGIKLSGERRKVNSLRVRTIWMNCQSGLNVSMTSIGKILCFLMGGIRFTRWRLIC